MYCWCTVEGMYCTIPVLWKIKSSLASPGRSHVGSALQYTVFIYNHLAELGMHFFWVFALALPRSWTNPLAPALCFGPYILRFCIHAPALSSSYFLCSYFRTLNFLSCYWFPFTLPVSFRPHVSVYIQSESHTPNTYRVGRSIVD